MTDLRIAVDFPWDASACMGTGAYSETMVRALAKAAPNAEIILVVPKEGARRILLPNVRYETLRPADVRREGSRQVSLPCLLRDLEADCLFAPATLLPVVKVCPMVATVHDLTFAKWPEFYAPELLSHLAQWFDPSIRAADHLVAVSDEAKAELILQSGVPPDRVTVIRQPIRETLLSRLEAGDVQARLSRLGIERPFFFHVSNLAPHKNVRFALETFAGYLKVCPRSTHSFILAGGGFAPNRPPDPFVIARGLGIENRVRYVGKPADGDLKALYQACDAFLFPSLAEGWGLPVAEAGALGARVLASPHVPAAVKEDRIPLDLGLWVNTLLNAGERCPVAYVPPDFDAAGQELYRVLESATGRKRAGGRSPRIALRADWRSPSGFGQAARNTFASLKAAGLQPACVPVEKDAIQDPRLWTGDATADVSDADVWVHHLPPSHFDLSLPGRHVALFCWETDRVPEAWVEPLNALDEVWVPAPFLREVLASSGVRTEVAVCPIAVDTEAYSPGARRTPRIDLPPGFDPAWTVVLYVGTWDPRKRPDVLVRAFSKAFGRNDRALLVLKSYVTGNPVNDRVILNEWVSQCRSGDAHVRVIHEVLTPDEIVDLFRFSTVFATASRGEGYCLPAVQALSCAKPVVAASWSALEETVSVPVQFTVENVPAEVRLPGYNSTQRWAVVDDVDLARQLRWVHAHRADAARLGRDGRAWVLQHASLPVVGRFLASRLEKLSKGAPLLEAKP